ncbi:Hypothetical predicted protein [Podarcis lilfordi]|uniref:Uncharacterized protein n=1 Tax=Podarcis lilfordi TaxID=74358 RepID=A0AA35LLY9_9SAUR|nr:Hypothetical predicted protein [Podarcis lilfordi]
MPLGDQQSPARPPLNSPVSACPVASVLLAPLCWCWCLVARVAVLFGKPGGCWWGSGRGSSGVSSSSKCRWVHAAAVLANPPPQPRAEQPPLCLRPAGAGSGFQWWRRRRTFLKAFWTQAKRERRPRHEVVLGLLFPLSISSLTIHLQILGNCHDH